MQFDLLIKGGEVVDDAPGLSGRRDVAVIGDRIAAVDVDIPADAAYRVVDATGLLVTPGLIDLHTHVYHGATYWGVEADPIGSRTGVTSWIDAGSPGALSLDGAAIAPVADSAARAGIPLVAFNVDSGSSGRRYAYVGENPRASGVNVGVEIARLAPTGTVVLFTPQQAKTWTERRLQGILTGLAASRRAPPATVVRLSGDAAKQQSAVEKAYARERGIRGLFAVDGLGTLACGRAISHLGLRAKGVKGGGYDLLPDDLELVADGTLDFVVDQQPYVQGFAPVLQLFLARISQGVVVPWDTETSVLLHRSDVRMFLATKSRFEGSSSRQAYPLRRS